MKLAKHLAQNASSNVNTQIVTPLKRTRHEMKKEKQER